jgi:hypothetical protein
MTLRRSSVRLLCRAGTAALLAGGTALVGAPAAAADEAPPVVALDPPDAAMFLIPTENVSGLAGAASTGTDDAAAALAQAAALAPPEIAETFGAEGVTVASHSGNGEVDVEYGGTVVVRLPALVDASAAEVSLDVFDAADEDAEPRTYSTDPAAVDPLVVADLGGNEFEVTLPADDGTHGPAAVLTFDGLAGTDPGLTEVFPLEYYLEFIGTGVGTVTLEPGVGLFMAASCAVGATDPCPATQVRAGESFDLTVPPSSLLRTLDVGRLDTAEVALLNDDEDWESVEEYYSGDDPSLITRQDDWSASVNLPAGMGGGTYYGFVMLGDPFTTGGYAMTSFELDVAAVNAGLHSDTGWVEDVREASADSTKAVAGISMLVVAGLITGVAVAPRRRPPTER